MLVLLFQILNAKKSTLESRLIQSIKLLVDVAEYDIDGFVRSNAERSANSIREWVKDDIKSC